MQSHNNKKIALIHSSLTIATGTTKCVFTAIEALNEKGLIPDVFAVQNVSTTEVKNSFGKSVRYNFKGIKNLKHLKYLKGFEIYKYPLINLLTGRLPQYDYIFNFTPSCIFTPDRKNYTLYIHFPDRGFIEYSEKYKRGLWKLYPIPISLLSRISKLGKKITIACNSQFTKSTLLKYYRVNENQIRIIYPPVEIESEATEHIIKKDEITSIGRFTSEKRQMEQIEIASSFPDLKFNIIGSIAYSDTYFRQCQKYVEKNNIKNVNLLANISRSGLLETLKLSKFFMHNMRHEHFGISTVEAIAQGCIPIVHNSGGQKEIVPFEELRFNDKDEAVKIIMNLQKDFKKDDNEIINRLKEHIKKFSEEKYKEGILKLINE